MEELVSRGVCPCVSVGGCVWPTPPLWGRWGPGADSGGTDTVSCLAEPSSKEPVPPAQAASCKLCPLGWPLVPSLARAERRPSQGALAPGSSPTAGQGLSVLGGDRPWAAAAPPGRGSGGRLSSLSTALSAQGSAPQKGHNPKDPLGPLRADSSSCTFVPETWENELSPGEMGLQLGAQSPWPQLLLVGGGVRGCHPLEDSPPVPPSHSGHGPVFQISPFPTLFPAASFTHPVLLKGALRRTNFLWTEQCPINLTRDLNLATFQPLI